MSKHYKALGLMSGTSLDGIDIAYLSSDGEAEITRGPARTYPYDPAQQELLQQALKAAAHLASRTERSALLRHVEQQLTQWHAQAVKDFLHETGLKPETIDVIGFHGQTVIHKPEQRLTVQLGDGAALARATQIPVVYDMRAADVAAGGQGAPLVPAYHRALSAALKQPNVAFINIGGVANLTFVGGMAELIAFDTGPGNALLNDWAQQHLGTPQDTDGQLAAQGQVNQAIIAQALDLAYFHQRPPKSLDRNSFQHLNLASLSPADGAATLMELTIATILAALEWLPEKPELLIITGGGRKNTALLSSLKKRFPQTTTAEELGLDGDAMEAEAWAYLAIRSLKHLPLTYPATTAVPEPLSGGVLAKP